MSRWKAVATALALAALLAAGLAVALAVGRRAVGPALLACILFAAAVATLVLARRLRNTLPPAVPFERLLATAPRQAEPVRQLEMIRRGLSAASWNEAELRFRLAPMIREITAVRLARRYGVDLDRQPGQAAALLGEGRLWDLVRPRDRPPGRDGAGWSRQEVAELLDELEAI